MPYVMVPVPKEHEQELMNEVLHMSLRASMTAWPPMALKELLDDAEPAWRALISVLTERAMADERPRRTAIAKALQVDDDQLSHLADAINDHCAARSWPFLIFSEEEQGRPDEAPVENIHIYLVAARVLTPLLEATA